MNAFVIFSSWEGRALTSSRVQRLPGLPILSIVRGAAKRAAIECVLTSSKEERRVSLGSETTLLLEIKRKYSDCSTREGDINSIKTGVEMSKGYDFIRAEMKRQGLLRPMRKSKYERRVQLVGKTDEHIQNQIILLAYERGISVGELIS